MSDETLTPDELVGLELYLNDAFDLRQPLKASAGHEDAHELARSLESRNGVGPILVALGGSRMGAVQPSAFGAVRGIARAYANGQDITSLGIGGRAVDPVQVRAIRDILARH